MPRGLAPLPMNMEGSLTCRGKPDQILGVSGGRIKVLLADDSVIVREGVKALLASEPDLEVVGEAAEYDEVIAGGDSLRPDVLVTDIRMPPAFQREVIDAAKEVRLRRPAVGIVILSQYAAPAYALSLLGAEGPGWAS